MITQEEYEDAQDIVWNYEDQIKDSKLSTSLKVPFKDAPIGARFKYIGGDGSVFVKLNSYPKSNLNSGRGKICSWKGNQPTERTEFYCFTEEDGSITYDTLIELV